MIKKPLYILLFLMHICWGQYIMKENSQQTTFQWPEGKRAALSLTFDDARPSQVKFGIPIFNRYNVKATFYVTPSRMIDYENEWRAAVKNGHEIGNHTQTHPCTGNYTFSRNNALEDYDLDSIEKDIDAANADIQDMLGLVPQTFAYPCGQKFVGRGKELQSYVPLIAKKFKAGRQWLNEDSNDPWICDTAQLLSMESDAKSFTQIKALIDKATQEGRWLILAGHETADSGYQTTYLKTLRELCEYVNDPENRIWVDTVQNIADYVEKHR